MYAHYRKRPSGSYRYCAGWEIFHLYTAIETGEIIAVPAEQPATDMRANRTKLSNSSVSVTAERTSDSMTTRAVDWSAYGEARFNTTRKTQAWSHTNMLITYMNAQNESYYSDSRYAGGDSKSNPPGTRVGAVSAYVDVTGGVFELFKVFGYHTFQEPGYNTITLSTSNYC